MKVVLAPNAFKDSLTAAEAAAAMRRGVASVDPGIETAEVPIADGGDGLFDVFNKVFGGERIGAEVAGPRFEPMTAEYLYLPERRTAVVEMARASGLALLRPEERNPNETTTLGTGQLTRLAAAKGARHIVIGIGGSATNDGGMGFASALGIKFLDAAGRELRPTGANLGLVAKIDASGMDPAFAGVTVEAVCDVDNPLCGPRGAAHVFGPQKGADPEMVEALDKGLENLAKRMREDLGKDVRDLPGAGAAGGLGAGLAAFVSARLRPGVDVVLDMVGIDAALAGADLAFTAEGRIDFQTAFGKGPAGVAARAKKAGVPCLAIAGSISGDIGNLHALGLDAAFSLCPGPMPLEEAIGNAGDLLASATAQALRAFLAGARKGARE